MMIAIYALAGLAGLILLCTMIGALRPRNHVATTRALLHRPAQEVWSTLSDLEHWSGWNSSFNRCEHLPDREGKPVWLLIGRHGKIPVIIETQAPPRRMVTRIPEDAKLGFSGLWTYDIEAVAEGTRLSLTEEGHVPNPFFRFVMMFSDPHTAGLKFLRDLGRKYGESVIPECVK